MSSNSKNTSDEDIIDVIDDFDYSTQNESYNNNFRIWRKKKNNPFSFSFVKNKKESVYIEGRGFIANSAVDAEKKVLSDIFYNIGIALLIYVTFNNVLNKIIISILDIMGVDVHNNYFISVIYGGSKEIVIVLIVTTSIKVLVPLLFLHFRFKLPAKVEFMRSMNNPAALFAAISMALIICTIASLPSAYSSETKEIYQFFQDIQTDISVWGQSEFIIYTIFDVIIISFLSEIFFRGAMFAVLRQFGDLFAILMTSLMTGFLVQDFNKMPAVILISLVASYGMLASGTLFTSIAVVIVYKMYQLAITVIEIDTSEKMPLTRNLFMIIMLVIGGIGLSIYWIFSVKNKKSNIACYKSELTSRQRFLYSLKIFPFSVIGLLCIMAALTKAVF